jgi:hypothetical protein
MGATKSDVLRRGLAALEATQQHAALPQATPPAELPTFRGHGPRAGVNLDNSAALLDLMDRNAVPR